MIAGVDDNLVGSDAVHSRPGGQLSAGDDISAAAIAGISQPPPVVRRRLAGQAVARSPSARVSSRGDDVLRRVGELPLYGARWQHPHRHPGHQIRGRWSRAVSPRSPCAGRTEYDNHSHSLGAVIGELTMSFT